MIDFGAAIKINPLLADAYNNKGLLLAKDKGDLEGGILNLTKAIEIDPNYVDAYLSRGMAYMRMGQSDKSIADYSNAIKISPKNPDAYYNRAAAYARTKSYDKAWDDCYMAKILGARMNPSFVKDLMKASGRKE